MMRILQVHNHYQQPGGEDVIVEAEKRLLEQKGHDVISYRRHNDEIRQINPIRLYAKTLWNQASYRDIRKLIDMHQPDIVHCHNNFPLVSPSIYFACNRRKVPVVQTLHNYRMFCANGYLLYNDKVCEYCLRHPFSPLPAIWRCYRQSFAATTVQLNLRWTNRILRTYSKHVDAIIVLTHFAKHLLEKANIPENIIFVKPNFIADPLSETLIDSISVQKLQKLIPENIPYFFFVGRLSYEKGISLLLDAWKLANPEASLVVAGDGPLADQVRIQSKENNRIIHLGRVSADTVSALMQKAMAVIVPSTCYEAMPTAIIEAFGNGKPVITSNHGAMAEMVIDKHNGILFTPSDPIDLADHLRWSINNTDDMKRMCKVARKDFLENYTAEQNYKSIRQAYSQAFHHIHLMHEPV